jgi:hypothetical protein
MVGNDTYAARGPLDVQTTCINDSLDATIPLFGVHRVDPVIGQCNAGSNFHRSRGGECEDSMDDGSRVIAGIEGVALGGGKLGVVDHVAHWENRGYREYLSFPFTTTTLFPCLAAVLIDRGPSFPRKPFIARSPSAMAGQEPPSRPRGHRAPRTTQRTALAKAGQGKTTAVGGPSVAFRAAEGCRQRNSSTTANCSEC